MMMEERKDDGDEGGQSHMGVVGLADVIGIALSIIGFRHI